jgi:hypothetical protein
MGWLKHKLELICQIVEPILDLSSQGEIIPGFLHGNSNTIGYKGKNILNINLGGRQEEIVLDILLASTRFDPDSIDILIQVCMDNSQKPLPENLLLVAFDDSQKPFLEAKAEGEDRILGFEFCRNKKDCFGIKISLEKYNFQYLQMIG